jgi:hypothetical protein
MGSFSSGINNQEMLYRRCIILVEFLREKEGKRMERTA